MSFKLIKKIAENKINVVTNKFRKKKVNEEETFKPLGFRIGAAIELDSLDWKLMEAYSVFKFPGGTHMITSHGTMTLLGDTIIHRFYTADKIFFQMVETNGVVEESRVFSPIDSVFPSSAEDWAFWVSDDPMIGQLQFTLKDGTVYDRAWFEDEEDAVSPVELEESLVYNNEGDALLIEHKAMQYGRFLSDDETDNTVEWLLVQAEDRGEDASIEIYVGTDLSETEFTVM